MRNRVLGPLGPSAIGLSRIHCVGLSSVSILLLLTPQAASAVYFGDDVVDVGPSLQALIESTDLSGVTISPDGQYASVRAESTSIGDNSIRLDWYVVSLRDKHVKRIASGGDPEWLPSGVLLPEIPAWSADSKWLYFKAMHSSELALWRADVHGNVEECVSGPSDVERFVLDDARHRVLYTVGPSRSLLKAAKEHEEQSGVILNGTQYVAAPLENNMPYGAGMASVRVSENWYRLGDDGTRVTMVFDFKSGTSRPADGNERVAFEELVKGNSIVPDSTSAVSAARSLSTGDVAYISHWKPRARDQLGRNDSPLVLQLVRSTDRANPRQCTDPQCRWITGKVVWRPDSDEFLFTSLDSLGSAGIYAWRPDNLSVRAVFVTQGILAPNPNLDLPSAQCPVTAKFAICVMERATDPPELIRIDLDTGHFDTLFDPNVELRQRLPNSVRHLSWKDERGFRHTGVLILPMIQTADPRLPLVITSYECTGFLRGGTGATVPEYVLARAGFAVLCVNTNGPTTGKETAPEYSSTRVPRGKATMLQYVLDSWRSAIRYLAEQGLIDRNRVGISGLSFTGEAVNYVLTHSHLAAAATSGHFAIMDPLDYYIAGGMGVLGRALIGGLPLPDPQTPEGRAHFRIVSPALNVRQISAPLLVQTDESEFAWGAQYYGALRLADKPVEVVVFPNESHIFWQPQHRLIVNERNIDWFRFWLQNYEDPNPSKREQYVRWDRLRADRDAGRTRLGRVR